MMVTNPHPVGFLVAEKSYKTRLIGGFCKLVGSIPVARPQDNASKGPGKICFDGIRMKGMDGTKFSAIGKGDRIRPGKSTESYKIKELISDMEAILAEESGASSPKEESACQGANNWSTYDILAHVDQGAVFGAVQAALADGRCLGIFPEGGSHDHTDLLPLKAGIAAIAFGVKDKYNINVPIVPVGLNYYRGHKFRGRVVVEFGEPMYITKAQLEQSRVSKRDAYQSLLSDIEKGMRSVIVTAPLYSELKLVHTARRLYQSQRLYAPRGATGSTTKLKHDLARRFAVAYKLIEQKNGGTLPDDLAEMKAKLESYQKTLERWGLYDYQLMSNLETSYSQLVYHFLHGVVVLILASIPSVILNLPVGAAANYWSYKEAQKDLKASRVKLAARDVLLSKKIVFSILAVPTLWLTYFILLILFTSWELQTIIVLFLCCPLFSYLGVTWVQAGIVDLKDLRPALLRLSPEFRQVAPGLPALRASLQKEVRTLIKKYGPQLGPLYYEKTDAWENMMKSATDTLPITNPDALEKKADEADEEILASPEPDNVLQQEKQQEDGDSTRRDGGEKDKDL